MSEVVSLIPGWLKWSVWIRDTWLPAPCFWLTAAVKPRPRLLYSHLHNSQSSVVSLSSKSARRKDSFPSVTVLISAAERSAEPLGDKRRLVSVQCLSNRSNRKRDRRSQPEAIIILFVSRPPFCFIQISAGLTRLGKRLILLSCQVCQHQDAALH